MKTYGKSCTKCGANHKPTCEFEAELKAEIKELKKYGCNEAYMKQANQLREKLEKARVLLKTMKAIHKADCEKSGFPLTAMLAKVDEFLEGK